MDSPARLFVESLNDKQFNALETLISDPWGTEALRLAVELKTMQQAYAG